MAKYSRLPKKKENEKVRIPALRGVFRLIHKLLLRLLRVCRLEDVLISYLFFVYVGFLIF